MAAQDFGGEMRFSVDGKPLVLRMKMDSEQVPFETDGGANQDGSTYRTFKPSGYMVELTFEDSVDQKATSLNWESLMRGGPYNATLVEDQTGRLFTWTALKLEGKPRIDHQTGEVTGVKGRSPLGTFNKRST